MLSVFIFCIYGFPCKFCKLNKIRSLFVIKNKQKNIFSNYTAPKLLHMLHKNEGTWWSSKAEKSEISFGDSLFQLLKVPCIICWILPWREEDHINSYTQWLLKININFDGQDHLPIESLRRAVKWAQLQNYSTKLTIATQLYC